MPRAYNKANPVVADHGDWVEVDISTGKHKNTLMKVDKDYWEAIASRNQRVFAMDVGHGLYASTTFDGSSTAVHRIIMAAKGVTIKHINGDGLDNRIENLRQAVPR